MRRKNVKALIGWTIIGLLIASLAYIILAPNVRTGEGTLIMAAVLVNERGEITKTLTNAEISLDGKKIGKGSLTLNVSSGLHTVSYGKVEGYIAPFPRTINVIPNVENYAYGVYNPETIYITIRNGLLSTYKVKIRVGTQIVFENKDKSEHLLSCDLFVVTLKPGQQYSYRFMKEGVYKYRLGINPQLVGEIIVVGKD